jgi:hypothetical protein
VPLLQPAQQAIPEGAYDVTIDATGVQLVGPGRHGCAILVKNSSRVTIRMFHTDSRLVVDNDGSHTYREDPVNRVPAV